MTRRMFVLFMSLVLLATGISVVIGARSAHATTSQFNVVALGDSYTSGNGALNYFNHECYRSGNAYVYQYAALVKQSGIDLHPDNYA